MGSGAAGVVFSAQDLRLDQAVALKLLLQSRDEGVDILEQYRDEARLARRVSHPNVCRVHDFSVAEDIAFVAMELIDGENLADLRQKIGRFSKERAPEIALDICRGLAAIHEQGLLHRDLKPANIMLDSSGHARILDFGLAAAIDSVSGLAVRFGTPAYRSPEQAKGLGVTIRSDLYSLGLVLWELWVGEHLPVDQRRNPPLISSKVKGVEPAVEGVIARCLSWDPKERPASAESVIAALQQGWGLKAGTYLRTVIFQEADTLPHSSPEMQAALECYGAQGLSDGDGVLWFFERPMDAVRFAVTAQGLGSDRLRLAIEMVELTVGQRQSGEIGTPNVELERQSGTIGRTILAEALPGQTLLVGHVCHFVRKTAHIEEIQESLTWVSHGRYRVLGQDELVEIFEVGVEGRSPLTAPDLSGSAVAHDAKWLTGWRPAPGSMIPLRPHFRVERRLGEGGFGEVWLTRHEKTRESRVFKFCFETSQVRGLQREITLFRLLKEDLGERSDIARVLDWNLDKAPYFIESEYSSGGDLEEWAQDQGGLENVAMDLRLEIVAQVAEALAAAHSVGVLHKDVKPRNILIRSDRSGRPRIRLADFGVGVAFDEERLAKAEFTVQGLTTVQNGGSSANSGTRLYLAPEILEGKPPTIQADIYALGVVLYQMVCGNLNRAVASGWRDHVSDSILEADLAAVLHGDPAVRVQSAGIVARNLRTLGERRLKAERKAQHQRDELVRRAELEQAMRRRKVYSMALFSGLILVLIMGSLLMWALAQQRKEAVARQAAERSEKSAKRTTDFLIELFDSSDPFFLGRGMSAVDMLELGASRLPTRFEDEPLVRARLMNRLGKIFTNLGEYDRARALVEAGLEIRRQSLPADHLELGESYYQLGYLGNWTAAEDTEQWLRKALSIQRLHLPDTDLDIAATMNELAWVLIQTGGYDEAEELFRKSLSTREMANEPIAVAESLNNLGLLMEQRGLYPSAEDLYRESLVLRRQHLGNRHLVVTESLNNLAGCLQKLGQLAAAEELIEEALEIRRELLGRHPRVASSLMQLGRIFRIGNRPDDSEESFREALEIRRETLGSEHPRVAESLDELAVLLLGVGRVDHAETMILESLSIVDRAFPEDHWRIANSKGILAACHAARGEFVQAEVTLLGSYGQLRDALGETSIHTRDTALRLADLYEAWKKPTERDRYVRLGERKSF